MATIQDGCRRLGPEALLAAVAALVFLGSLGSVELWGKREQRAAAEAIDTVDHHHWLLARLQGRPRLEKPPLPRWSVAALVALTGRRDEWVVRLPSALAALGMVGLVYGLGSRIGGRSAGLASGLALTSTGFFVGELRQGGNDGPLAFFTTLALYAAWRRLHDAPRRWNLVFYAAMGLGFLCKGPVVLMVVAVTVLPSLACERRLRRGLALLADAPGALVFLGLALSWPVPVLLSDPTAARVWLLEMGQKAGTAEVWHSRHRLPMAADWPWMTLPWGLVAATAALRPFTRTNGRAAANAGVWFPWWWSVGNLGVFCLWAVAKPSYYLPCLPGVAVLSGLGWVALTRAARRPGVEGAPARRVLQLHWVALFTASLAAPVVARQGAPGVFPWALALGLTMAAAVVASARLWRLGSDAGALAPPVLALGAAVLVGYGVVGPAENALHGHRALAAAIDRALPADARSILFFHDLDEGLWFYLRGRDLSPVPGSQPTYGDAYALAEEVRHGRFRWEPAKRLAAQKALLASWLTRPDRSSPYLLIHAAKYDRLSPALAGLCEPLHRERGLKRNALVLLRATDPPPRVTRRDPGTAAR